MAKLFRPDTCGCEIELAPDWSTAEWLSKMVRVTRRCPDHAALPNDAAVWSSCYHRTRAKNEARDAMLTELGIDSRDLEERIIADLTARLADYSATIAAIVADPAASADPAHATTLADLKTDLERLSRPAADPFRFSFRPDGTLEVWASDRPISPARRSAIVSKVAAAGWAVPVAVR